MKNYICIDGVKTKLSCETAESLKQRFGTEKPKEIKCGDYGLFKWHEWKKPVFAICIDEVFRYLEEPEDGCTSCGISCTDSFSFEWQGNLGDDLERNSKDLEEFEVGAGSQSRCFTARWDGTKHMAIKLGVNDSALWFEISQVVEIHQKLGQLIATAKRKAEKDC